MPSPSRRPQLAVIATGGTIANTWSGRVGVDDVLADIEAWHRDAEVSEHFEVKVSEVTRESASRFDPSTWVRVRDAVQRASDSEDVKGVVVTHGTVTVEETAYYLHLTVDTTKPLVLTCSQRKHGALGNDGDQNLLHAFCAAASPSLRGAGALLVANEELHSAREVVKTSKRPDGFKSPSLGPLGYVDEDQVSLYRSQRRRHTADSAFARQPAKALPRVDIVSAFPGAKPDLLKAAYEAGAQGIVIHGYAFAGKPSYEQVDALLEIAATGLPVILASRGREGRIPLRNHRDPFVRGDNLPVSKAHVLATTAIASGITDPTKLQRVFDEH